MDTYQLIQRLAVALAIGLIIGIERGWKKRSEPEGERVAGLRTLSLARLLGGVWGALALGAVPWGMIGLGLAFFGFTAVIASSATAATLVAGAIGLWLALKL
jgi:hypothetical protein